LSFVFILRCIGGDRCDELITRSEESYRVCMYVRACVCLIVRDTES